MTRRNDEAEQGTAAGVEELGATLREHHAFLLRWGTSEEIGASAELRRIASWWASREVPAEDDDAGSALRAIDPTRGEVVWEQGRPQSGVLATAGHVVFHGTSDGFVAVNAETGQELWHMALGDAAKADPITYAVEGKQYVTMFEGNTLYTFGLRD